VKLILKVGNTTVEEEYLGSLTHEGRMSGNKFKSIKERLVKHFSSWAKKYMSSGAKEVLIKPAAHAIPTYVM
jgi:hypothetical protein